MWDFFASQSSLNLAKSISNQVNLGSQTEKNEKTESIYEHNSGVVLMEP